MGFTRNSQDPELSLDDYRRRQRCRLKNFAPKV